MDNETYSEGIIRPSKGKHDPELPEDVLMIMIPSEMTYLAHKTGSKRVSFSGMILHDLYQHHENGKPLATFAGPFIGAPHAVMGLEKLIALGARRVLVMGWCGSLQPDLKVGDLIIPTHGVSEEGTSRHYPVTAGFAVSDNRLNEMLALELEQNGISFTKGPVWTTDALYRETPRKVRTYQKQNILAVEMEMSALLTVARFRHIRMSALLVVSDELSNLKWRPGFHEPQLKKRSHLAADLLLDLHQNLGQT